MIATGILEDFPDRHPERPVHDAREMAEGQLDLPVSAHHVRVFDLMDKDQRTEYEKLYVELAARSKTGSIIVSCNVRETLSRSDGSTGWFRYVEWTEFNTDEVLGA